MVRGRDDGRLISTDSLFQTLEAFGVNVSQKFVNRSMQTGRAEWFVSFQYTKVAK